MRNKETGSTYGMKIFKVDCAKINRNSDSFYKYHRKEKERRKRRKKKEKEKKRKNRKEKNRKEKIEKKKERKGSTYGMKIFKVDCAKINRNSDSFYKYPQRREKKREERITKKKKKKKKKEKERKRN